MPLADIDLHLFADNLDLVRGHIAAGRRTQMSARW